MDLLVVRPGYNWEESEVPKLKNVLEEKLPMFIIMILEGENKDIETSFEIVKLH